MKWLESILKRQSYVIAIFTVAYVIYVIILFVFSKEISVLGVVILFIIPFLLYEIILRLALFSLYGRRYQFALYNYFLVNHPIYGNCFRLSADTENINFPLFDRFVFKPGVQPARNIRENKKDRIHFRINSLGFRGTEFSVKKEPGTIRIFCSGGSTSACNSLDDEFAWPAILEQYLNKNGYPAEVINGGVQGWYSYQELLRFQHEIVNYEPDVVLLHQGWNEEFNYSSQNLGSWWHPHQVRNLIEEKYLYSEKHPWLSSTRSILLFFAMRAYFKDHIFDKNMSFNNPKRWECLRSPAYVQGWVDTLINFAQTAQEQDISLYTFIAPGLSDFDDSLDEREIYVQNTRLTANYSDYQAISQKRIARTLKLLDPVIPTIDTARDFHTFRGPDRLALFEDEIHMSEEGNRRMGELIGSSLLKNKHFLRLPKQHVKKTNVRLQRETLQTIREEICKNDKYVNRFVSRKITKLKRVLTQRDSLDIPSERYTTF